MDENKNTGSLPQEQDLLTDPVHPEEITADEAAMRSAGLTHPDDMSATQIIAEVNDMPVSDPAAQPEELFRDQEYTDTFGGGEELERVFSDEPYVAPEEPQPEEEAAPENEPQEEDVPVRKGRPKRKKGAGLLGIPHILATAVWLVIVLAVGVSLGRVAWVCVADVLAFGREEKMVEVTIEDSDTIEDIALKLQEVGLIRYTQLFALYADITDAREDISSGTFTVNTLYDYNALVNSLTTYSSSSETVSVMIPEGYNCAQIFALMEEKKVCSAESLATYAAEGELDEYWFLEGVERGTENCLEGFLFPDTYDFYVNDSAEHVLEKLLDNFDRRFSEDKIAAINVLNQRLTEMMQANGRDETYIAEHLVDIRDIVTIASLIEKETAGSDESFVISSVIYNRLYNWGNTPRYLNIDAALLYVLGHKEALTQEDLKTDTPYNTYLYTGLVPGPISNPGLNSLNAALDPDETSYYYYVLDPEEGVHIFSKTAEEHNAAVAKVGG